jgi:hypothetical protein
MMHTDSEQSAIDIMNAMPTNIKNHEDKATRRETRYEKWKRTRKAKSGWVNWSCCWFGKSSSETKIVDTTPLTSDNVIPTAREHSSGVSKGFTIWFS